MEYTNKNYFRIIDRLKNRDLPIEVAKRFENPEYISIANEAIREMESVRRRNKRYSKEQYKMLMIMLSNTKFFIEICKLYVDNPGVYTKPSLSFKFKNLPKKERYNIDNLKVLPLKERQKRQERSLFDEMESIQRNMKNAPSLNFFLQFDDPEKIRLILMSIKNHNEKVRFNFNAEEKEAFILKFYNDVHFNYLYQEWLRTGNKFIKPSLDHKVSRANGGTNDLDNLHYISYLENISKNSMNWDDWKEVKNNLSSYFLDF